MSGELKFKLDGGRVIAYPTFKKTFGVEYDSGGVVAVDVNENNVTVAMSKGRALKEVYRIETGLGRIVIAYSERRRIAEGRSATVREVRGKLRRLREREGKHDMLRKTARIVERFAEENNAVVVVGSIDRGAKEGIEEDVSSKLRHRIHQWGRNNN